MVLPIIPILLVGAATAGTVAAVSKKRKETVTEALLKQITNDVTHIMSDTIQSSFTKASAKNLIEIGPGCTLEGVTINQTSTFTLDIEALQKADTSSVLNLDVETKLKQAAENTSQSLSFSKSSDTTRTASDVLTNVYTQVATTVAQSCFAELESSNIIRCNGGSVKDVVMDQNSLADLVQNCVQNATVTNDLLKTFTNELDQDVENTEEDTVGNMWGDFMNMIERGVLGVPFAIVAALGVIAVAYIVTLNSGSSDPPFPMEREEGGARGAGLDDGNGDRRYGIQQRFNGFRDKLRRRR